MKHVVKNYFTIFTLTFYILKLKKKILTINSSVNSLISIRTDPPTQTKPSLISRIEKLDPDTILTRTLLKSDVLFRKETDINGFNLKSYRFSQPYNRVLNVQQDNLVTYKK